MRRPVLLIAVALLALLHCLVLALGLPVFTRLYGWFWRLFDTPLGSVWPVLPALAVGGAVVWAARRRPGWTGLRLILLVLLAYSVQMGVAFMEGRGIDGIRSRIVSSGHAEFPIVARELRRDGVGFGEVAARYEEMVVTGELGVFPRSKPPGQLLLYMALDAAAVAVLPAESEERLFDDYLTLVSFLFPLLSCMAIFPLYYLSRMVLPEEDALVPSLLYALIPGVTLITMHMDQVLYPTLFVSCVALLVAAGRKGRAARWGLGIAAGALTSLSVFITFSLLPLVPMLALVVAGEWFRRRGEPRARRTGIETLIAFALGFALVHGAIAVLAGYDPVARYRGAMGFHDAWKRFPPGILFTLRISATNLTEFACWSGLPLSLLCLAGLGRSIAAWRTGSAGPADTLSVSFAGILLLICLLGNTVSEVARLWLFLSPVVCLVAAREAGTLLKSRSASIGLIAGLQVLTILCIKRFQDFF